MTVTRHSITTGTIGTIGVPRSSDFTLTGDEGGDLFVATAPLTVTVPNSGVLENGFECAVVNDSGDSVVIDGNHVTDVTLSDGEVATIYQSNNKQRVMVESSTVIADVFAEDAPWDPSVFGLNYDLVHWWDASAGITIDNVTGKVNRWEDTIVGSPGTQTNNNRQPHWQNGDEVRLDGTAVGLVLNTFGRAAWESKWWIMLFRVNWTAMAASTDNPFLNINGITTASGSRQPYFTYKHATHQITTSWLATSGVVSLTVDVPGADDTWHSLIARRDDVGIYASVDGAAEVSLACYPRAFLGTGQQPVGSIGNNLGNTTTNITSIGLDSLIWGQRELTSDDIAKAHAWALWKRGAEASLDGSSPYLVDAPLMSLADQHVAPPDSWADGYRFGTGGTNEGWDDTVRGNALDLSGYTRTFHDHFTSLTTVSDGLTGAGPWWAPAHIDTSGAKFKRPVEAPHDTWTLLPDNTTLQIKLQLVDNTNPLKPIFASGHMQTVDVWRNGFSQAVPPGGASYFEASMAMNAVGTDSITGNPVDPAPAWNAFWLYTIYDAKDSAYAKAEIDVIEAYGDRVPSIYEGHFNAHRHSAYRPQPGNAGSPGNAVNATKTPSKILDMTQAPFNATPSLFDGQGDGQPGTFHQYGVMIDETWITWYFDGVVVSRYATYKEALDPLFMLVSLQSQDLVVGGVPGQGGGTPNCTTYMWVDYVDAWVKS